jgi:sugar lactone lactonase YvrE
MAEEKDSKVYDVLSGSMKDSNPIDVSNFPSLGRNVSADPMGPEQEPPEKFPLESTENTPLGVSHYDPSIDFEQQYYSPYGYSAVKDPNAFHPVYVVYDTRNGQPYRVSMEQYHQVPETISPPVETSPSQSTLYAPVERHTEQVVPQGKAVHSRNRRKWLIFSILIFVLVSVGAILGIYFGLLRKQDTSSSNSDTTPTVSDLPPRALPTPTSVSIFAGSGSNGTSDGVGRSARFNEPIGITRDRANNLFVTEPYSNLIRRISPSGSVSTFAGNPSQGFANGQGTSSSFRFPVGITTDRDDNLYVADRYNHVIRRISPSGSTSTFAGSGTKGGRDGARFSATFDEPNGLAFDSQGNLYVVEYPTHKIRRISPDGTVSTFAGNGSPGNSDGFGSSARFHFPASIAIDANDTIYVSDSYNHAIRKLTPSGLVSTFAGSGSSGRSDGRGIQAAFFYPGGLAVDSQGNLYVADYGNNLVRRISVDGMVSTLAGSGTAGQSNGVGSAASFNAPNGVVIDSEGSLYITDQRNHMVRKISV